MKWIAPLMKLPYSPLISVVMSVYNAPLEMVKLSINCVLNQTIKDIEFIIVDDNNSIEVIGYLKKIGQEDSRIYVIHNSKNIGLTKSLIKGIVHARGKYIARQDADDLSKPSRLEKQVKELENKKNMVLLGCWYEVIDEQGVITGKKPPNQNDVLKKDLYIKNPFCHASVMFRKSSYFEVGGYDQKYATSQDLDLWFKLSEVGKIGIVEEVLVTRQLLYGSVTSKKAWLQVRNSFLIRLRRLNNGSILKNLAKIFIATSFHAYVTFINGVKKNRSVKKVFRCWFLG